LDEARKSGIKKGLASGISVGALFFIRYSIYTFGKCLLNQKYIIRNVYFFVRILVWTKTFTSRWL